MNSPYLFSWLIRVQELRSQFTNRVGHGRNHEGRDIRLSNEFSPWRYGLQAIVFASRATISERELLAAYKRRCFERMSSITSLTVSKRNLSKSLRGIGGEMERMKRRKGELKWRSLGSRLAWRTAVHSPAVIGEILKREREITESQTGCFRRARILSG